MQYKIWKCLIDDVEKELKRVQRKCSKYNCKFNYEIHKDDIIEQVNGKTFIFNIVDVEGKAIINDYQLVGISEYTKNGNIMHKVGEEEIPKRFYNTDNYCEHCNRKRARKQLFLIKNIKTNEYKQVGKSCVKLYTNGIEANRYLEIASCYHLLEDYNEDIPSDYESYENYNPLRKIDDVLNLAIMIIDKLGYISTNNYYNGLEDTSTKHLVQLAFIDIDMLNKETESKFNVKFTQDDYEQDRTKEIKAIKEYYSSLNNNDDYTHNVKVLLKNGYIENNQIGYICYLPIGYRKEIERQENNKIDINPQYYGEVGKRYKNIKIDNIKLLSSYNNCYGSVYVYQIISDDYIFIWKTSKYYDYDMELKRFSKIDMTIKEQSEYKGTKQNIITRCKLYKSNSDN